MSNKGIDRADGIRLVDVVVEALGQERDLRSIRLRNEPLHAQPPAANSLAESYRRSVFTQPGSEAEIPTLAHRLPHPRKQTSQSTSADVGFVPCVDGSVLARIFLHVAGLVGAAMCSAFVCGSHDRWP